MKRLTRVFLFKNTLFNVFSVVLYVTGFCSGDQNSIHGLGNSRFTDVINSANFVDKTMLIKDFFHANHSHVLITAPRGFGKSTNMDMIKTFCEIKIYKNGSEIPKEHNENFEMFSSVYQNINGNDFLNIHKQETFFSQHFAEHPVIYVDFNWLSVDFPYYFTHSFLIILRKSIIPHAYLFLSSSISVKEKHMLNIFFDFNRLSHAHVVELEESLRYLSSLLYKHFKRKVIVLIDEFDAPIQKAIFRSRSDLDKIIPPVKQVISRLLISNDWVEKALINACTGLWRVFSPDNLTIYPFLADHEFNTYFGLTESEVFSLAKKLKVENKFHNVRAWYEGYAIESQNIKVYNLWSVVNFLQSGILQSNYWVDSASIESFSKMFFCNKVRTKVLKLLSKKMVKINYLPVFTVNDTKRLKSIVLQQQKTLYKVDADLFLQFLTENGYFDIVNITSDPIISRQSALIKVPNYEMFLELSSKVYDKKLFNETFNFDPEDKTAFADTVLSLGSKESFQKLLTVLNVLFSKPKSFPANEADLSTCIYKLLKEKDGFIEVCTKGSCNFESKVSRPSTVVTAIRHDGVGIIFRLKCQIRKSDLNTSAETSLEQILTNACYKIFKQTYYKNSVTNDQILIGVHMTRTGKFSLCYLINNHEFSNRTCLN